MAKWLSDCSNCCASVPPGGASEAQEHHYSSSVNMATNASANAAAYAGLIEPGPDSLSGSHLVSETADRTRMRETNSTTERQWVAVTAYQPIDTVIKTVEVPVVQTVEKFVPKLTVEEKIVEVPKYIPQIVEKVVEVPEVQYVDKIIEVPEYQYQYKCVPKIETRENIIERPRIDVKYIEKLVEVPQIKEVVRYHDVETVEEVIKYVPKGEYTFESSEVTFESSETAEGDRTSPTVAVPVSPPTVVSGIGGASSSYSSAMYRSAAVSAGGFGGVNYPGRPIAPSNQALGFGKSPYLTMPPPYSSTAGLGMAGGYPPFGLSGSMPPSGPPMGAQIPGSPYSGYAMDQKSVTPSSSGQTARSSTAPFTPRVEHVYKPKVVKTVEFQKHLPISVDVPVPYMVPKPIVVPVQVPVLKFRDHFIPVPVRRRVVPRIRWTNEVYEVECVKEKPYMLVQDVIKPVPCDVEIRVHEFVEKAQPINPTELSQADVHAMWMRVNADLAEKRKDELGDKYPYVEHPPGTVFGEPGIHKEEELEEGGLQRPDPEVKGDGTKEEEKPKAVPAAHEGDVMDPISLHPGHPLSMTYLQNQWIKKDTTSTHQMYTPEWFDAHQKALHGMTMQHPTQIQLSAEQAAALQPSEQPFGRAPWFNMDVSTLPVADHPNETEEQNSKCCGTTAAQGEEQNADEASCCSSICR